MTGTDVARFTHKQSQSYLNHLVYVEINEVCSQRIGETFLRYLTAVKQRQLLSDGKSCTPCPLER